MMTADMIETINVLIVDDEALARDTLRLLLDEQDDMNIVGEAADGNQAVEMIQKLDPDLVFLDVQMPGRTGLDVVADIGADNMPTVVFVTAYNEYAVKAFETSAIDYLVKPFSDQRFEAMLDRVRGVFEKERHANLESRLRTLLERFDPEPVAADKEVRFIVKERGSIRIVDGPEIDWVEAAGDYVILHCGANKHMIRETMSSMDKKLAPIGFVRIHRSTIVRIDAVRELKPYFHGDYIVYLKDGKELKLSRRYWAHVESILGG